MVLPSKINVSFFGLPAEGDTGIVESTHGFHIMYFSSFSDKTYFNETADLGLRNAKFNKQYDEWCKLYPVTFNDEVLQKIDA